MLTPYPETREEVMRVEEENVLLLVQGRGRGMRRAGISLPVSHFAQTVEYR